MSIKKKKKKKNGGLWVWQERLEEEGYRRPSLDGGPKNCLCACLCAISVPVSLNCEKTCLLGNTGTWQTTKRNGKNQRKMGHRLKIHYACVRLWTKCACVLLRVLILKDFRRKMSRITVGVVRATYVNQLGVGCAAPGLACIYPCNICEQSFEPCKDIKDNFTQESISIL